MPRRTTDRRTLATLAAGLVAQALFVFAFVLPGHEPSPHGVPVGVVGPPAVAERVERSAGDRLDVTRYTDPAAARQAIQAREVYGVLMPGPAGGELLVASAASPAVAQLLERTAHGALGSRVAVTDVAPLDPQDPRGATLNLLFLPLIVVCLPTALLLGALKLPVRSLLGSLAAFAALGGLVVVGLVHLWLGALPGSYLALSGVVALALLAIAIPAAGLERLLGRAGVALAGLLFFLVGNPASGNASAPELLPSPWREVGSLLPPGAGGTAVRNTAYFDGAALTEPLLVLGGWALLGAGLVVAAGRLRRVRPVAEPVAEPAPAGRRPVAAAA